MEWGMGFFDCTADDDRPRWADCVVAVLIFLAALVVIAATITPAGAAPTLTLPGGALSRYAPGTIVISQSERRLYLLLGDQALSYPVAVGRSGKQWQGQVHIDGKYRNPAWAPPAEVKRAEPWLPNYIPGGSPRNPMGVRALTLSGDQYAIHGTNRPESIGKAASFGCIRMSNSDILDLYDRVSVGTPVVMTH